MDVWSLKGKVIITNGNSLSSMWGKGIKRGLQKMNFGKGTNMKDKEKGGNAFWGKRVKQNNAGAKEVTCWNWGKTGKVGEKERTDVGKNNKNQSEGTKGDASLLSKPLTVKKRWKFGEKKRFQPEIVAYGRRVNIEKEKGWQPMGKGSQMAAFKVLKSELHKGNLFGRWDKSHQHAG